MNERILELAKTAGLKFSSETALSPLEEKFAELIVKECLHMCEATELHLLRMGSRDESLGVVEVKKLILDYFGVQS